LTPKSLGKLTYGEFLELYEGYKWREKKQHESLAILASWVALPHSKERLQPNELMKELEGPTEKERVTQEEKERVTREIEEKLGVR
jgi:hypothetical protein